MFPSADAYPRQMAVVIRLLGSPSIEVDGEPAAAPRGRKAWALLCYLVLTERPPSRRWLASILFPGAEDPLGALRWSLADLRRCLGPWAHVGGDPVRLTLADGVTTDAALLTEGTAAITAAGTAGAGSGASTPAWLTEPLLEGVALEECPAFEAWLQVERRRLAGACEALLHETALLHLGSGRFAAAVEAAGRLVATNPLDENHHTLLVRCLTASGRRAEALEQVARCHRLFERELGVSPSPAVRAAADAAPGAISRSPLLGRAAAAAQLEAGQAAVNAGAIDAGLECLRRAVAESAACSDAALSVAALIALGSALVHGARGRDEEGAAVLHEALVRAEEAGDQAAAARASRELGFVDVQAGRRQRAEEWLSTAEALAVGDDELAAVLGVRGMNLSDMARYGRALETLERSVEAALRHGSRRQAAWSGSLVGRVHVLRGEPDRAAAALDESLALVRAEGWTAFAPWPQSLRAEVDRAQGRGDASAAGYAHAFALACHLGDPCWEGMAARGSGLLQADAGDVGAALRWLDDARTRCNRWPDAYQWVRAYVLDATCDVGVSAGDPRAAAWAEQLAEVAARGGMPEFVVRSHVHRARLGQAGAAQAAVQAAPDVDSPVTAALVAALPPG